MELEEILKAKGVDTLEELEAKIRQAALAEGATGEETLRKQIKDLETIKDKQGDTIGSVKKELDEVRAKLLSLEKNKIETGKPNEEPTMIDGKKPEDAPAQGKSEEQWRQDNEARELALTDSDWTKLDEAAKVLDPEVRKLAVSTEEGRAAFMAEVLGSAEPGQETFRRPVQKKKLTVAEQIQQGLNKTQQKPPVSLRASGSGFSADRKPIEKKPAPHAALLRTGSLRDMVAAHKVA